MRAFPALLALASTAAADGAKPCFDTFNGQPFETVCYKTLAAVNASGGALTVRAYEGAGAEAHMVSYAAPATVTTYQEALMLTSFYVIYYFTNHSLAASRTVPLTLRPPTSGLNNAWVAQMALAPSLWPPGSTPPPPLAPTQVSPRGRTTLASLRVTLQQSPQPSDFEQLCAQLRAGVQAELPAWSVDEASPISPTHARYSGEEWEGPYEVECWVGVVKV